jgi:hypothetical protein
MIEAFSQSLDILVVGMHEKSLPSSLQTLLYSLFVKISSRAALRWFGSAMRFCVPCIHLLLLLLAYPGCLCLVVVREMPTACPFASTETFSRVFCTVPVPSQKAKWAQGQAAAQEGRHGSERPSKGSGQGKGRRAAQQRRANRCFMCVIQGFYYARPRILTRLTD